MLMRDHHSNRARGFPSLRWPALELRIKLFRETWAKSPPGCPAWLGNVGLMIGATLATLFLIELAFRLFLGHSIVLFPRNHAAAQYGPYTLRSMTPNVVFWHQSMDGKWRFNINNKGFRDDKNYSYGKPKGTLRVLVLGDSHTAGFEVDQDKTYANVLEKALRQQGISAEVLNTGISGFSTAEELAYLENEGLRYSPDVIIVGFFANDYSDNVRANLFRLVDGKVIVASERYAPAVDVLRMTLAIPGLKWLGENSYAYSYVFNTVWDLVKAQSIRRAAAGSASPEYAVPVGGVDPTQEELTQALLRRIAEVGQRNAAFTVLADIPVRTGPYEARSSFTPETRNVGLAAFPRVLESEEYLSSRPATQALHVPNGHHHINAYTHRRLGEALAQIVTARLQTGSH
jgi:lysophospholipase L1-like esterase